MSTKGYNDILNSLVVWFIVIGPLSKYTLTITPIFLSTELFTLEILFNRLFKHKMIFIILYRTLLSSLILGTAIVFPEFERAMVSKSGLSNFFFFWMLTDMHENNLYIILFNENK